MKLVAELFFILLKDRTYGIRNLIWISGTRELASGHLQDLPVDGELDCETVSKSMTAFIVIITKALAAKIAKDTQIATVSAKDTLHSLTSSLVSTFNQGPRHQGQPSRPQDV